MCIRHTRDLLTMPQNFHHSYTITLYITTYHKTLVSSRHLRSAIYWCWMSEATADNCHLGWTWLCWNLLKSTNNTPKIQGSSSPVIQLLHQLSSSTLKTSEKLQEKCKWRMQTKPKPTFQQKTNCPYSCTLGVASAVLYIQSSIAESRGREYPINLVRWQKKTQRNNGQLSKLQLLVMSIWPCCSPWVVMNGSIYIRFSTAQCMLQSETPDQRPKRGSTWSSSCCSFPARIPRAQAWSSCGFFVPHTLVSVASSGLGYHGLPWLSHAEDVGQVEEGVKF